MKIAGIDLSLTATGVCVLNSDGTLDTTGLIKSKPQPDRTDRIDEIVDAVLLAAGGLADGWASETKVVAIEGYSFGSKGDALTSLAELRGVLRHRLRRAGVVVLEIAPGRWRKILFGKGNLKKDEVRLAVERKFKHLSPILADKDINVVEAFCVATAALREWRPGG